MEDNVACAEIHCRGNTQLEMLVQAELAEHTNIDARVPTALFRRDKRLSRGAVSVRNGLRTHIVQLYVLQMRTHNHTEMERAQVSIGTVLHDAVLCGQPQRQGEESRQ